jgi:hypothetical protein
LIIADIYDVDIQSKISIGRRDPHTKVANIQSSHIALFSMASFFDLKARKAASSNGASSSKDKPTNEAPRAQPWVEK